MNLVESIRNAGVVGAGGAGFPAHVKAASQVEYVVANGAECEPLMYKDAELMSLHAGEIVEAMQAVMAATGATKGIIGVKEKHAAAISAFEAIIQGTGIELHILGDFYPTGDEFILVHETTGRLIPPAGIPLDVGVVVQNVETLYNIFRALNHQPVTQKYLTIAGAVEQPLTCSVPIGTSFATLIEKAGGATVDDCALFVGGAMMGQLTRDLESCVDKTTGGLIVLPADHTLVQRQERPEEAMHQVGKSACDQCTYCTELCPRYLLGYELEPHKVMRGLVFSMAGEDFWNKWGTLCCECGLCTLLACPEDLYPREACQRAKREFGAQGLDWTGQQAGTGTAVPAPVKPHPMNESRRIPLGQLIQRLGLTSYDRPAPFVDLDLQPAQVKLPFKQHVGVASCPLVQVGERVEVGQLVAEIPHGQLGARLHASIGGTVGAIEPEIAIVAD